MYTWAWPICGHTHTYTHIHTHLHAHTHSHTHTYMHTRPRACTHTHTHTHTHTFPLIRAVCYYIVQAPNAAAATNTWQLCHSVSPCCNKAILSAVKPSRVSYHPLCKDIFGGGGACVFEKNWFTTTPNQWNVVERRTVLSAAESHGSRESEYESEQWGWIAVRVRFVTRVTFLWQDPELHVTGHH